MKTELAELIWVKVFGTTLSAYRFTIDIDDHNTLKQHYKHPRYTW